MELLTPAVRERLISERTRLLAGLSGLALMGADVAYFFDAAHPNFYVTGGALVAGGTLITYAMEADRLDLSDEPPRVYEEL